MTQKIGQNHSVDTVAAMDTNNNVKNILHETNDFVQKTKESIDDNQKLAKYDVNADYDSCEEPFGASRQNDLLKKSEDRFCIFPIRYKSLWAMYKKAVACFWTTDELQFNNERHDFNKYLTNDEQHFIKYVLAFFAQSDGIVIENLVDNFCNEIQCSEARSFYTFQSAIETIHGEAYSLLIDTYIESVEEKASLFSALDNFPTIRKKADWALKWISNKSAPFAQRIAAFAMVEGIFFSGSFAAIYWIRQKGILHALTFSNELIARDEGLHTEFAAMIFNELCPNPTKTEKKIIKDMAQEAFSIESDFFESALPVSLIGMNADLMCQYIKYVTDQLLFLLIHEKHFYVKNPFDFMENISLEGKTNFFERKVSEYQKMNVLKGGTNEFKTDVNF